MRLPAVAALLLALTVSVSSTSHVDVNVPVAASAVTPLSLPRDPLLVTDALSLTEPLSLTLPSTDASVDAAPVVAVAHFAIPAAAITAASRWAFTPVFASASGAATAHVCATNQFNGVVSVGSAAAPPCTVLPAVAAGHTLAVSAEALPSCPRGRAPCDLHVYVVLAGSSNDLVTLSITSDVPAPHLLGGPAETVLQSGVAWQSPILPNGNTTYFNYTIPVNSTNSVRIEVDAPYGRISVGLYVLLGPFTGTVGPVWYDYSTVTYSSDASITINANDWAVNAYCNGVLGPNCTVHIAVTLPSYGYWQYAVTAFIPSDIVVLPNGIAFMDNIPAGNTSCFIYTATPPYGNLKFVMASLSGNPNMYISNIGEYRINASNQCPTPATAQFSSTGWFDEIVLIPASNCTSSSKCYYVISVIASFNMPASFILLGYNGTSPVPLTDGIPAAGVLTYNDFDMYSWSLSPGFTAANINLQAFSGYIAMYGTFDGQLASSSHFQFVLYSYWGNSVYTITPASPTFNSTCNSTTTCPVNLQVVCLSTQGNCTYNVIASTQQSAVQLADGVAVSGSVQRGQFDQYAFQLGSATSLTFDLTVMSGDPDVYIAVNPNVQPNSTFGYYNWSMISITSESLTLQPADYLPLCPNNTLPCTFYIAITAFYSTATYTFLASAASDVIQLLDGQPQLIVVQPNTLALFNYQTTSQSWPPVDVFVSTTALSGVVQVFANARGVVPQIICGNAGVPFASCLNYTMNASTYDFKSRDGADQAELWLPGTLLPAGAPLTIAVVSLNVPFTSQIVIGASSGNDTTQLQAGVPAFGACFFQHYKYYAFTINAPNQDVSLSVSLMFGAVDVYVSLGSTATPTMTSNDFASDQNFQDTHVMVVPYAQFNATCQAQLINGLPCTMYIGIHGRAFLNATFSLTASLQNSPQQYNYLIPGQTQFAFVNTGMYQNYKALVPASTTGDLYLVVQPIYGDPDLYANFNKTTFPNSTNFDMRSISIGTSVDMIQARQGITPYCVGCAINVAVFGWASSYYAITFDTAASQTVLTRCAPFTGIVAAQNYTYFRIRVDDPNVDVTISLVAISGDPDMYVSLFSSFNPGQLPTRSSFTWAAAGFGNDALNIPHNTSAYTGPSTFLIGVYGFTASQFTINVVFNVPNVWTCVTGIQNSVPQVGVLTPATVNPLSQLTCNYFQYSWGPVNSTIPNIRATVTSLGGGITMYATNFYNGSYATLPNAVSTDPCLQKITHAGSIRLNPVNITTGCVRASMPVWVFGVCLPLSQTFATSYVLDVGLDNTALQLLDGIPMGKQFVRQNSTQFYFFPINDFSKNISVIVTATSGDADVVATFVPYSQLSNNSPYPYCYISPGQWFQTCVNATWSANSFGSDTLFIANNDPYLGNQPGQLLIGVFGFYSSTFSIVVSQSTIAVPDHITLLDGYPQVSGMQPVSVCATRDPNTGVCNSLVSVTNGAYFQFYVPYGAGRGDSFLMISKRCGNTTGTCWPDLTMFVSSCTGTSCPLSRQYPSTFSADTVLQTRGFGAALHLSNTTCYNATSNTTDCSFYVGIFPSCPGGACNTTVMGNFEIEFTTPAGVEVIDESCLDSGALCNAGPSVFVPGGKDYEIYSGLVSSAIDVYVEPCIGAPIVTACVFGNSSCPDMTSPSQATNDAIAYANTTTGIAKLTVTSMGVMYVNVSELAPGNTTMQHSYVMRVGKNNYGLLTSLNNTLSTSLVGTTMSINWTQVSGIYTGTTRAAAPGALAIPPPLGSFNVSGVTYFAFAIPTMSIPSSQFRTNTACGVHAAYFSALFYNATTALPQIVFTPNTTVTFTNLTPGLQYLFQVVGRCTGTCGPTVVNDQYFAYGQVLVQVPLVVSPTPSPSIGASASQTPSSTQSPAVPSLSASISLTPSSTASPMSASSTASPIPASATASPTASLSFGASASPSPSNPTPNSNKGGSGMSPGATAAVVIVVLVVVGAAAGGFVYWRKKNSSVNEYVTADSAYTRMEL